MSVQHTQYTFPPLSMGNAAQYDDLDFNSDFTLFDNEPLVRTTNNSTSMSNDKQSELFLSFGHELSSLDQSTEPIYSFNFEPITPIQPTPYQSSYESPLTEFFDTPIMPFNTPFFSPCGTPYETPFSQFADDPELSPAVSFKEYEKDEGYGTTEYNRLYPDHFDGNPFTLVCTPADDRPHDFDDDESSGSLFAPLSNNRDDYIMEDTSTPRPANRTRKSSDSSDAHRNVAHDSPPRRFPCKYPGCDKAFARLFNLTTHEKTHDPNREKPFFCKDCQKTFARKHDLFRHEASVHRGERLFSCKRCTKPFSRKDALRRHVSVKGCPGTVSSDAGSPASSDSSPEI